MADVRYEVEQIVGKKINCHRNVSYLVKWKGFSSDHDSWEPAANLFTCKKLITWYNSNPDNPVIREDNQTGAMKKPKTKSPKKQGAKQDGSLTLSKTTEKEKGLNKEDAHQEHTLTTMDTPSSPNKGANNSKENHKKSLPSKQIQADIPDKPSRGSSSSSVKLSAKKPKSSDNHTSSSTPLNSASQNNVKKAKPSVSTNDKCSSLSDPTTTKVNRKRKLLKGSDKSENNEKEKVRSHQGPSMAKKQKVNENVTVDTAKSSNGSEDVIDLTKSDTSSECESELPEPMQSEQDEDDENVLYSLNADCDLLSDSTAVAGGEGKKSSKESVKSKKSADSSKNSVISKVSDKDAGAEEEKTKTGGKKKNKRMSLMDSKKAGRTWSSKSDTVRSVTPPPYTSVKDVIGDPTNKDPSKPSGNSLPDPVSPEASETYLADVPSSFPVPAEEPLTEEPLSPGSMLYKSLVENLPDQLHLTHKGNGKKNKGNGNGSRGAGNGQPGKSLFSQSSGKGAVERRTSVRSSECAFRYKQIVVKKCARYTQIWLNTTTVMKNALNPLVIQEIVSALNSAKYDDSRLVLFSGLGNVFCSGTDLHFLVSGDRPVAARQMAEKIRELTKTFITFPKPIIAAVSGAAVGMGMSLLTLCDVVYASDKASFHMPYSQLSQTPEGCSSFTLPLTVGLPSANELLYGGRKITAIEAYQLGLLSQVFWPTLMMQEIIPRVQNMAICSSKALEATKLLVRSHHRTKLELTNETEANLLLESWLSAECQQAIEAYISNEKNIWF